MGGMNLRTKIRAPMRYGESSEESPTAALLESMRRSRAETTEGIQDSDNPHESHPFQRKLNVEFERKSIIDFDPNLPPAAFPTVEITKATLSTKTTMAICEYSAGSLSFSQRPNQDDDDVDQATLNDIENHVASNNELNPVYLKNMAIMAGQVHDSVQYKNAGLDFEDSDLDEPKDASVVLGEKVNLRSLSSDDSFALRKPTNPMNSSRQISDPTWADIVPHMQVEIVENMFKDGMSWKHIYTRLEIPRKGRNKFKVFLETRNQQMRREDRNLAKMRENQLRALMRIDNSDIKTNDVPHQLVLRRSFGKATQESMSDRIPDFFLCQAADVLAGRQYLARRSLPRSLAGAWDHSLVALRKLDDEASFEPEQFEWKEDLTLAPELSDEIEMLRNGDNPILRTKRGYIQCVPGKGTVYIRDLDLKPGDEQPTVDWRKYFPYCKPIPDDQVQDLELYGQSDGLVRLAIGPGGAAQIQWDDEETKQANPMVNFESSPWTPPRQVRTPNPEWPPVVAPDDTPMKMSINPRMLADQLAALPGQPCEEFRVGKEIHRALSLTHPRGSGTGKKRMYSPPKLGMFSVGFAHQSKLLEEMPLKRSMGGCWSMSSIRYVDPAIGQNRYTQQIQEAKYEAQISKFQVEFNQDVDAERARREEQEERVTMAPFSPIRGRVPDDMFCKYLDQRVPPSDENLMGDSDLGSSCGSPGGMEMCCVDDVMKDFMVPEDVSVVNKSEEFDGDDETAETIDDPMVDSGDEMVMVQG
ncbi:uncharacterized protein N7503_004230 [Penicillium pulvis]|uniref:uncharacterized protein n=1 Tax=Penicillium pulvis TaxID=1562058 RepID=UPI002548FA64|nr:uncharacterized protein N7503_004230 [Penicillium pulvis]KAJ5806628.1 hypothetical protein N7503_004230 [Penicillium pulvis]